MIAERIKKMAEKRDTTEFSNALARTRQGAQQIAHVGGWTPEEVQTVKTNIMPEGATATDLQYFLGVCKQSGLNPFTRQVFAAKGKGGKVMALVSIDGFRSKAESTGRYAGQAGPFWCGSDGVWQDVWLKAEPPIAAKVGVIRTDFKEPIWAVARYQSYVQTCYDKNSGKQKLTDTWLKMPDVMVAKCAEALALRKAFPDVLGGLYTRDEMEQANVVPVERNTDPNAGKATPKPVAPKQETVTETAGTQEPDEATAVIETMFEPEPELTGNKCPSFKAASDLVKEAGGGDKAAMKQVVIDALGEFKAFKDCVESDFQAIINFCISIMQDIDIAPDGEVLDVDPFTGEVV